MPKPFLWKAWLRVNLVECTRRATTAVAAAVYAMAAVVYARAAVAAAAAAKAPE